MPSLSHFAALVTGSAGALATVLLVSKRKQLNLSASLKDHSDHDLHNQRECPGKWDYNWDKMEAKGKDKGTEGVMASEGQKSTATRTLILIRHGQYVWDPNDPNKRILTELGRKQAAVTGQRLKDLGYSYSAIHYSTMPRATETCQVIQQSVVGVPTHSCDLMREGAPIRPEPMHKKWRPESYVR